MGTNGAIHVLWVLVFAALVSGCATVKAYPGPDLPREQIALIEGVSKPDISITIEKVDGAPVQRSVLHTQFAVVPDWHTIDVRYVGQHSRPGGSRIEHGAPIELRVFVEAGRVYRVRGSTVGNTWRAWI